MGGTARHLVLALGFLVPVGWAAAPCTAATPVPSPERASPSAGTFLDTPAGRLYYEVRGEGEALVLLHDGLIAGATWDAQTAPDAFPSRYRVVRFDRRGRGRSEPAKVEHSDVDDLAALMDALAIPRAVLVGCSSGGALAVDFALAHPGRVTALVLEGPVASGLPLSDQFWRRAMENLRPMFESQDLAGTIELWVRDPWLTDARNTAARERLRALLTADPSSLNGRASRSREAERPAAGRLGEIAVPTLIVIGVSDLPDVHAHGGALEAGVRGAKRVLVDGAGHLVHLEQPAAFNALVLDFLRPGDVAARTWRERQADLGTDAAQKLTAYDPSAPLGVELKALSEKDGAAVMDLSYASPRGGRVAGYLVLPRGRGPFPGVLFLHPGQGDRSTFLDEAIALAGRGIAALTIDNPEQRTAEGAPRPRPWDAEGARADRARLVVDARRGLDLLAARPEVDSRRLGLVGHSLGSKVGAAVAALDERVTAAALMAGFSAETAFWSTGDGQAPVAFRGLLGPAQRQAFLDAIAPYDSIRFLPQDRAEAAPAAVRAARRVHRAVGRAVVDPGGGRAGGGGVVRYRALLRRRGAGEPGCVAGEGSRGALTSGSRRAGRHGGRPGVWTGRASGPALVPELVPARSALRPQLLQPARPFQRNVCRRAEALRVERALDLARGELQLEQRGAVVGCEVGPGRGRKDAARGRALAEGARGRFEQGVAVVDHRRCSFTAMPEAARHSSTRRRARVTFWRKVLSCIASALGEQAVGERAGSVEAGAQRGLRPGRELGDAGEDRAAQQRVGGRRGVGRGERVGRVVVAAQVRLWRDFPPPPPRLVDRQVARQAEREAQRGVLAVEVLQRRDDPHPQQRLLHDRLDVDRARERAERAPQHRLHQRKPGAESGLGSAPDLLPRCVDGRHRGTAPRG